MGNYTISIKRLVDHFVVEVKDNKSLEILAQKFWITKSQAEKSFNFIKEYMMKHHSYDEEKIEC